MAEPFRSFDQAMRAVNTMAGKSAEDFGKLKDEVKALSKEIPIARDLLANGLYHSPEESIIKFLLTQ
ncbi:MAG: hypothetical protein K2J07_07080 [Muribaculaceae bacterium]|nr:hypothetical protein [Muribaculaceae bacterium]